MRVPRLFRTPFLGWLCALAACQSWQVSSVAPEEAVRASPGRLRVTVAGEQSTVVLNPVMRGDSLAGRAAGSPRDGFAVPISAIHRLEIRRPSAGRTLALIGGIAAAGAVTAAAISAEVGNQLEGMFGGQSR